MTRLALLQAFPALFAIIQIASGKPFTYEELEARSKPVWPATVSGEVHDSSWANFSETTIRWSSFEAPTFNSVFLPKTEQDLSLGVSALFLVPRLSSAAFDRTNCKWRIAEISILK
jgi:hypothetical protein